MTRIFVEGRDARFLECYLKHLLGENNSRWEIISAGGYTKLPLLDLQFKENTEAGGANLVLFDADFPENGGGFDARRQYLLARFQELSVSAELFLFPDNRANGDFETLLEHVASEEHACLLRCFEQYETCVSRHRNADGSPKYMIPTRKSKIYAYVESIKKSRREAELFKRDKDFFFDNPRYWNLDSPHLSPLKDFLLQSIKK